jgi:hypothetical protein
MKKVLVVKNININFFSKKEEDFISLTDIAKYKNSEFPADVVKNWMRSKNNIEFLGFWEKINNPDFKLVEFDQFWKNAGVNSFVLSPGKWIKKTGAIGIISKSGRGGGTFAHKDIAFEFASWISAEFKLYVIKEFQRLKEEESERLTLGWDMKRTLTKINYDEKYKRNYFRHNFSDKLLNEFESGIQKSFDYLEIDNNSLFSNIEEFKIKELSIYEESKLLNGNGLGF